MTLAGQRWTRSTPTEPGWYWWRAVNGTLAIRPILVDGGGYRRWLGDESWSLDAMLDGEWQGPIFPNEATE